MPALRWIVLVLAIAFGAGTGDAQTGVDAELRASSDASPVKPAAADRDAVQARLAALRAASGENADAGVRAAIEQYQQAEERLQAASASAERAARWRREAEEAPGQVARLRDALSRPADPGSPPPTDAGVTLGQLEQGLASANAELAAARTALAELTAEPDRRQARRGEISAALTTLRAQLEAAEDAAAGAVVRAGEAESEGRAAAAAALVAALSAEVEALDAEAGGYDATRDLLPLRTDLAARRVAEAERSAAAWLSVVNERRRRDADAAVREAERQRRDAAAQHPALQSFAAETQRLAAERAQPGGIPQQISALDAELARARERLTDLRTRYESLRKRLEVSGINRATGVLLRSQFEALGDAGRMQRRVRALAVETENAEYLQLERRDAREAARDLQGLVGSILDPVRAEQPGAVTPEMEATARELAAARRDLLDKLVSDAGDYVDRCIRVEVATRELLEATRAFRAFIGERILWVRSVAVSDLRIGERFRLATSAIAASWPSSLTWASALASMRPWAGTVPLVLVPVLLFAARVWARARIRATRDLVARFKTDAFRHTVWTLVLTVVASLAPASALWAGGVLLSRLGDRSALLGALASGMLSTWPVLLGIGFTRYAMIGGGLLDAHFRWPPALVGRIRRGVTVFAYVFVPAVVIMLAADALGDEGVMATYGRASFAAANMALTVLAVRVLWPTGAVMEEYRRRNAGSWLERTRVAWASLIMLTPLALIVLSALGYSYTAAQLEARLLNTLGLVMATVFVHGLLLRWLFITRRRVAVEDARRRREQAAAPAEGEEAMSPTTPRESSLADEDRLDLPAISARTRQLFGTGIAVALVAGFVLIWSDVLPALRTLERVEIFPRLRVVESEPGEGYAVLAPSQAPAAPTAAPAATPGSSNAEAAKPVAAPLVPSSAPGVPTAGAAEGSTPAVPTLTLLDVVVALVLVAATTVVFRNLPGLVEMLVLSHLPLDAGSRFALTTVLRYAIVVVGLVAVSAALGIAWSRLQWLVAALTFGLAFGLQEIFANFISGLIILAERPIRIGDTVTVGQVSGTVTRIRMRATTITDWDRKELIIPNKNFITGEVINWTLSDTILRVIVPVGVAYGTDTRRAEAVLLRVAASAALVLKEPKAYVLFNGFGDSTLNLELRVFIGHADQIIAVRHELNHLIAAAFREEGIEIAFPQRDLHIRSADPIAAALAQHAARRGAPDGPGA